MCFHVDGTSMSLDRTVEQVGLAHGSTLVIPTTFW